MSGSSWRTPLALIAFIACLVLAPGASAAKLKVTATPTIEASTLTVAVKVQHASGKLSARLQRQDGKRWKTVADGKLKRGKATLRWAKGKPGTSYRYRVQILRGKRVIATTPSKTAKLPKPAPVPTPKPTTPAPTTPPAAQIPAGPPWMPTPGPPIEWHQLAMGGYTHGCAIEAAQTVKCWGNNERGQLGDGTTVRRPVPTRVVGLSGVTSIVAGGDHTCALVSRDGSVWCWGDSRGSQLGPFAGTFSATPVKIEGLGHTVGLVSGWLTRLTCAVDNDWISRCWGDNADKTLPISSPIATTPEPVPQMISALDVGAACSQDGNTRICTGLGPTPNFGQDVRDVALGSRTACAIIGSGQVRCVAQTANRITDPTNFGNEPNPSKDTTFDFRGATDLTIGSDFACAARGARGEADTVVCWGVGATFPKEDLAEPTPVAGTEGVVGVRASGGTVCGIKTDGTVVCWGAGSAGERGDGVADGIADPVPAALGEGITQVSLGRTSCGIAQHYVDCWGTFPYQRPGLIDGTTHSRLRIPGSSGIDAAVGVWSGGCGLSIYRLVCWGDTPSGAYSPGSGAGPFRSEPGVLPDMGVITAISANGEQVCGIREYDDPGVVCISGWPWTAGSPRSIVPGSATATFVSVLPIGDGLCFIAADGTVSCTSGQTDPVAAVPGATDAIGLDVGGSGKCLVTTGGEVRCWGLNGQGQLGRTLPAGVVEDATAAPVTGLSGAKQVAVGALHGCAIVGGGQVRCWGNNEEGQLGARGAAGGPTPRAVAGIADALTIDAYDNTTCVTRSAHDLTCWGDADRLPRLASDSSWRAAPIAAPQG